MQNAHYATELLHLLSTGLGGGGWCGGAGGGVAHGTGKALQLILSSSWKSTAAKLLRVAQQSGLLEEHRIFLPLSC